MIKYKVEFDLDPVAQGDTLEAIQFKLTKRDGSPHNPTSVCAQIRGKHGELIFEWDAIIYLDGVISLPEVTADWPVGNYNYAVRYFFPDGTSKIHFGGKVTITRGLPKC